MTSEGAPARLKPLSTARMYENAKNAIAHTATIPDASPSSPSTKLTALITNITKITVSRAPILDGIVKIPLIGNHKIWTP